MVKAKQFKITKPGLYKTVGGEFVQLKKLNTQHKDYKAGYRWIDEHGETYQSNGRITKTVITNLDNIISGPFETPAFELEAGKEYRTRATNEVFKVVPITEWEFECNSMSRFFTMRADVSDWCDEQLYWSPHGRYTTDTSIHAPRDLVERVKNPVSTFQLESGKLYRTRSTNEVFEVVALTEKDIKEHVLLSGNYTFRANTADWFEHELIWKSNGRYANNGREYRMDLVENDEDLAQEVKATATPIDAEHFSDDPATQSILNERSSRYGGIEDNGSISQKMKKALRQGVSSDQLTYGQMEILDNICQKMARIVSGDTTYLDNWQDIVGYGQLGVNLLTNKPT